MEIQIYLKPVLFWNSWLNESQKLTGFQIYYHFIDSFPTVFLLADIQYWPKFGLAQVHWQENTPCDGNLFFTFQKF